MAESCKACGKEWTVHLGVEQTCALLQEALTILKELVKQIHPPSFLTYGYMTCRACGCLILEDAHLDWCAVEHAQKFIGFHIPKAKTKRTPRSNSMKKRRRSEA